MATAPASNANEGRHAESQGSGGADGSAGTLGELFDSRFLQRLEYLNLIARQLIQGRRNAVRASVRKGASIEFRDFRSYSPGDDPRAVDWTAYARLGELFVKVFRQEQELDLWVMLDRSGSMAFGDWPSKFDVARRIAAALSYIGLANMDASSILPFGTDLEAGLQRMRGKGRIFQTLDFLRSLEASGRTDFDRAVRQFTARVRKPGLVVVLSDFYTLRGSFAAIDRLRALKHEVHLMQMVAPWELAPPLRGELRLVDAETGDHRDLTITDSLIARYKSSYEQFGADVRSFSMGRSVGYARAVTTEPFDEFLRRALRQGSLLA